jgi:hypothetical protein
MKTRIAGFTILGIGAVLIVLLFNSLLQDVPVWFFGRRADATIEDKWWEDLDLENSEQGVLNLKYYFQYRFETSKGEEVIGKSQVTEEEFLSYQPGGKITVKYSVLNPSANRIDDSRFVPFLLCSYTIFILISLFLLAAGREMIHF